jgi:prepilin-type N-terminal cleavage/methylation domain-containing protein
MLAPIRHSLVQSTRDERGYTLIELLVAMVAGIAVTGALFSILDVSLRQTSRLTDKVQTDQLGRTTMTNIVDELHSSCLSYGFAPVQGKSSENELRFITGYSPEPVIPSATEHRIKWESSTETLTDYSYPAGGSWPTFTSSSASSPTSKHVASNVRQTVLANGEKIPIFQYYEYATAVTSGSEAPTGAISTTGLLKSSTEELKSEKEGGSPKAVSAASVQIAFTQAPSDGYSTSTGLDRNVNFNDQVTLAFSVPNDETPIHDAPCQ